MLNELIGSRGVLDFSEALHRACESMGHSTIWLAVDRARHPLPPGEGVDWHLRTPIQVPLRHPEIDLSWWPGWYPLRLDRAQDSHALLHSVAWAMAECQPKALRAGRGRRVAGWLLMRDADQPAAVQHWARSMVRRRSGRAAAVLLRLHDPAVLWSVWQLLSPAQRRQWLGPVAHWYLLDPTTRLTSLADDAAPGALAEAGAGDALSALQWQDIELLTPLHQALRASLDRPEAQVAHGISWHFNMGLLALRRAQAWGLNNAHSLALFAETALLRHPAFDRHPRIQRLLNQRTADEPLGGVLSELDEADWMQLTGEMTGELGAA